MPVERYLAIDNVCAWPNLTLLPNGDIVAVIFNQPCHGRWQGDVDCWASTDGGLFWEKRSCVAPHEPGTVRMNVGGGLARNGDLVYVVSGWDNARTPDDPIKFHRDECNILEPWVCRSTDGGTTWTQSPAPGNVDVEAPEGKSRGVIPFGNIVHAADGSLAMAMHTIATQDDQRIGASVVARSYDDGKTWGDAVEIGDRHNETDLVAVNDTRWLATSRSWDGGHLTLFVSDDAGKTWQSRGPITAGSQHPSHLLHLGEEKILLTYGIRHRGLYGIGARFTHDGGDKWYAPMVLVNFDNPHCGDGGYPACVKLDDDTIVTAYYAQMTAEHHRYHVGVARWRVDEQYAVNTSAYKGF